MTVETKTNILGFSLAKDTWGDLPSDAVMAQKYFLDIANQGSPEMVSGMREILKAMWMRLAVPSAPECSDADLGAAIGEWYRVVSPMPTSDNVKVITHG